jgi:prepilin-type N-terminal cleavage/methylation domain-containing protein
MNSPLGYTRSYIRASDGHTLDADAFTLVELLVVIGVITVLIAILLPVLRVAREQTRTVACASNQRQILASILLYAQDNKGLMPYRWTRPMRRPRSGTTRSIRMPRSNLKIMPSTLTRSGPFGRTCRGISASGSACSYVRRTGLIATRDG